MDYNASRVKGIFSDQKHKTKVVSDIF